MSYLMTVIPARYDGSKLSSEEFERAVAYLGSHGYRFHGEDKVWTGDLDQALAEVPQNTNLITHLGRQNVQILNHNMSRREELFEIRADA